MGGVESFPLDPSSNGKPPCRTSPQLSAALLTSAHLTGFSISHLALILALILVLTLSLFTFTLELRRPHHVRGKAHPGVSGERGSSSDGSTQTMDVAEELKDGMPSTFNSETTTVRIVHIHTANETSQRNEPTKRANETSQRNEPPLASFTVLRPRRPLLPLLSLTRAVLSPRFLRPPPLQSMAIEQLGRAAQQNLTPEELEDLRRERNRMHAKRTRDRKKILLEVRPRRSTLAYRIPHTIPYQGRGLGVEG